MENMRYCRALYNVVSAVNSHLEPVHVLKAIVQSTTSAVNAKGCSIMLLSPDRRELRHTIAHGLSDWYVRKGLICVDQSMSEALAGHSVAVLDAGSDPRVQYRAQAVKEGIASVLCIPIRLRDEVIGVMRVYTSERREFSLEDIEFAEAAANLGAMALANARRYAAVTTDLQSLEAYLYRYAGA